MSVHYPFKTPFIAVYTNSMAHIALQRFTCNLFIPVSSPAPGDYANLVAIAMLMVI